MWRLAQDRLAQIVPDARHVIARKSTHFIQAIQPNLVIDALRREPATLSPGD